MSRRRVTAWRASTAGLAGFLAGAALTAIVMWNVVAVIPFRSAAPGARAPEATVHTGPSADPPGAGISDSPRPAMHTSTDDGAPPRIGSNPVAELRTRGLLLPVDGIDRAQLHRSFDDARSGGRDHEAIDILAARHTPVLAVENGVVARLFTSKAGGTTIYQFDPTTTYVYYYAHLQGYAPGLADGSRVRRGQVIGYVGTTGNAPPDTPHLHFAIFRLTEKKQWWDGTPIDPFEVLR